MTNRELIERLADERDLSIAHATSVLECLLEQLIEALGKGEEVQLGGFGSFEVKQSVPKTGRNRRAGRGGVASATRQVTFRPGSELRHRLTGGSARDVEPPGPEPVVPPAETVDVWGAAEDLPKSEPSPLPRELIEAARSLQSETTFLWQELVGAARTGQTTFACEIRKATFGLVEATLDQLREAGLCDWVATKKYSHRGREVLQLQMSSITSDCRALVVGVAADPH